MYKKFGIIIAMLASVPTLQAQNPPTLNLPPAKKIMPANTLSNQAQASGASAQIPCVGNVCGYFIGPARVRIYTGTNDFSYDEVMDIRLFRGVGSNPASLESDTSIMHSLGIGSGNASYHIPANNSDSFVLYPSFRLPVKNANGSITPGNHPEKLQIQTIRQSGLTLVIHYAPVNPLPFSIKRVVLVFSIWDVNTDFVPRWQEMRFEFLPTTSNGGSGAPLQWTLSRSTNTDLRLFLPGSSIPN